MGFEIGVNFINKEIKKIIPGLTGNDFTQRIRFILCFYSGM